MDHDKLLDLLLETATLKRMPRTGWAMRGVPHVESVAEHSFGTALVALALAEAAAAEEQAGPFDVEQVLIMALLHDLAEVRLTDLPASAVRLIPPEVKSQAEAAAISDLLAPLPAAGRLAALWQAFEDSLQPRGQAGARRRQAGDDGPVPALRAGRLSRPGRVLAGDGRPPLAL